jgi:hypothetical protein
VVGREETEKRTGNEEAEVFNMCSITSTSAIANLKT